MMKFKFFKGDTRTQEEVFIDTLRVMDQVINQITELNQHISNLTESLTDYSISLNDLMKEYEL